MQGYSILIAAAVAIAAVPLHAAPKKLPDYVKPCKIDDPELEKCALKTARDAFPSILKGDRTYNIPNLIPLIIEKAEVPGNGLSVVFTNAKIWGIENVDLRKIKFDPKAKHMEVTLWVPYLTADTDYKVDGKILVLPIKGEGKANITLFNSEFVYSDDYVLEKKADGEEYLKIKNPQFEHDIRGAYFHLDNLFGGDKALSDTTHKFLNENWKDVVREMAPPLIEVVKQICDRILTSISSTVPYKDFWAH